MVKRGKRGLSDVVSALLMILLVFVAVGIVWIFVRNIVQQGAEQVSLGKFTLDLRIDQVQQINDSALNVKVKRDAGEGEFVGIKFIVSDGKNTETVTINGSMVELERRVYTLVFLRVNISNMKKIQIAPIFLLSSGKEVAGDVKDEYTVSSSGIGGGSACVPSCPTGAVCGSDGCGGFCGTCASGETCSNYQCTTGSCTPSCIGRECGSDGCSGSCGTCSLPNANSTCSATFQCTLSSCINSDYANCDGNVTNGCEVLLGTTSNCGSCGNVCTTGQTCVNNVCIGGTTNQTNTTCTDTCSSLGYTCGNQLVCGASVNCGTCSSGQSCSAGTCVAQNTTCTDTCSSLGYTCGTYTICGVSTNCGTCPQPTVGIFVSTTGSDSNSGTISSPLRTLDAARDLVRTMRAASQIPAGGITVWLRGGIYERTSTFDLTSQDSGTVSSPVVYSAYPGETVRIMGGRAIPSSGFTQASATAPTRSGDIHTSLSNVWYVDLDNYGITDTGTWGYRGYQNGHRYNQVSPLEVSFNGQNMQLARFPNSDDNTLTPYPSTVTVTGGAAGMAGTYTQSGTNDGKPVYRLAGTDYYVYYCVASNYATRYWGIVQQAAFTGNTCPPTWYALGSDNNMPGLFEGTPNAYVQWGASQEEIEHGHLRFFTTSTDDRHFYFPGTRYQSWSSANWQNGNNPLMQSNLAYIEYYTTLTRISLDSSGLVSMLDGSDGLTYGQPFYILNVLEELDQPGEWYHDKNTNILYIYPTASMSSASVVVTTLQTPIIRLTGTDNVKFENLIIESGRGNLIYTSDSDNIFFYKDTIRNAGASGAYIYNGENVVFHTCTVSDVGSSGIVLVGGDRTTLSKKGHTIFNSVIHDTGRWDMSSHMPVILMGAASVVEKNEIYNAPQAALFFRGNDFYIERNSIHDVTTEVGDYGAIYTGRDFGYQGNFIRNNLIRNVGNSFFRSSYGIYLDDAVGSINVFGNIILNITDFPLFVSGGRNNVIENNVIAHTNRIIRATTFGLRSVCGTSNWNVVNRLNNDIYLNLYYGMSVTMDHTSPPWSTKYPYLAMIPNDCAAVDGSHWEQAEGSAVGRNIAWDAYSFSLGGAAYTPFAYPVGDYEDFSNTDNLFVTRNGFVYAPTGLSSSLSPSQYDTSTVSFTTPVFVNEAGGNYNLNPSGPEFSIRSFQNIPVSDIGPSNLACTSGQTLACGIDTGACVSGHRECNAEGSFSEACVGEVKPTMEICNGIDDDCDGMVDEYLNRFHQQLGLSACTTDSSL